MGNVLRLSDFGGSHRGVLGFMQTHDISFDSFEFTRRKIQILKVFFTTVLFRSMFFDGINPPQAPRFDPTVGA